jgi:hypothetical protein
MENMDQPTYEVIQPGGVEEKSYQSLPKFITFPFGVILYSWAIYLTFLTIVMVIALFEASIGAGLALLLTPLGYIFFVPAVFLAWSAPSFLSEYTSAITNPWEYYTKVIFGYFLAFVTSYAAFFILMALLGFALSLVGIYL